MVQWQVYMYISHCLYIKKVFFVDSNHNNITISIDMPDLLLVFIMYNTMFRHTTFSFCTEIRNHFVIMQNLLAVTFGEAVCGRISHSYQRHVLKGSSLWCCYTLWWWNSISYIIWSSSWHKVFNFLTSLSRANNRKSIKFEDCYNKGRW